LVDLVDKMRLVGNIIDQLGADVIAVTEAVSKQLGTALDEDTKGFIETFIAGYKLEHANLSP